MASSPIDLGAYVWWRCDQKLSVSGGAVQSWTDVISSLVFAPDNSFVAPGITSGRYTTTAVNFDIASGYTRALSNGNNWDFLCNGASDYHVFICCRYTGVNPNNGVRSLFNTSYKNLTPGLAIGNDATSGNYQAFARIYTSYALAANATSANGAWNSGTSPGSLVEVKFHNDGGAGNDLFMLINGTQVAAGALGTPSSPGSGLKLGATSFGAWTSYGDSWRGYVEDVVIFKKVLSDSDAQSLRDYFRILRGVPGGLALAQGYANTSFSVSGGMKRTISFSKNVGVGFAITTKFKAITSITGTVSTSQLTSGSLRENMVMSGKSSIEFSSYGALRQIIKLSSYISNNFTSSVNERMTKVLDGSADTMAELFGITNNQIIEGGSVSFGFFSLYTFLCKVFYLNENINFSFDGYGDCSGIHSIGADLLVSFSLPTIFPKWKYLGFTGNSETNFNVSGFLDQKIMEGHAKFAFIANGYLTSLMQEHGPLGTDFIVNGDVISSVSIIGGSYFDFSASEQIIYVILFSTNILFDFDVNGIANVVNGLISGTIDFDFKSSGSILDYAVAEILTVQKGVIKRVPVLATDLIKLVNGSEINSDLHYHRPGFSSNRLVRISDSIEFFKIGTPVRIFDDSGRTVAYPASAASIPSYDLLKTHRTVGISVSENAYNGVPIDMIVSGELLVSDFVWDVTPVQDDVGSNVYLSVIPGKLSLTKPLGSGQIIQKVGILTRGNATTVKILIEIEEPAWIAI